MAGALLAGVMVSQAWATSTNPDHQISVFSIENYGSIPDSNLGQSVLWKDTIVVTSSSMDAYNTFYDNMTNCTADACAHGSSFRKKDSNVTVNAMVTGSGGFDNTDLLFFYGHNISMQEWNLDHEAFHVWVPYNSATHSNQAAVNGSWMGGDIECSSCPTRLSAWGTTTVPYYYHQKNTSSGQTGINDASSTKSYGVFYAYNPITSILIGKDYTTGTWQTENTNNFGSDETPASHTGQLGTSDVDFIVANGCEGVPVAEYQNHTPAAGQVVWSAHAQRQWKPSWRGLHLAVGHYFLTTTGCLPNVTTFANDIKAGTGVIRSYFESHSSCAGDPNNPAMYQPGALAPRANVYDTDKWTSPEMADPTTTDEASANWSMWAWAQQ